VKTYQYNLYYNSKSQVFDFRGENAMVQMTPTTAQNLRQAFKGLNRLMLLFWRLGLGGLVNAAPETGGQIMILVQTGRKSGLTRRTPVNYTLFDGELYCIAGFGPDSDWYLNIQANPQVEVWLPDSWYAGEAIDVTRGRGALARFRAILIASGFAARVAGIDPTRLSDADLAKIVRDHRYRLLQIKRTGARTGPGGPGDLAWIWPLATFLLLPLVFLRLKRSARKRNSE
jgi:deazaflavin-dependent oxidoreductase (nitroreductase family)